MSQQNLIYNSARQALNLLLVPPPAGHRNEDPTAAIKFFSQQEIYPGICVLSNFEILLF